MVTAIVIPIICLYFYLVTKKEMGKQDQKWLETGKIRHESMITGEIKDRTDTKQRYYYNRYLYVQELKLQTDTKVMTVKKITPLTKDVQIEPFQTGETIRAYGSWKNNQFYFNDYDRLAGSNRLP